jgi:hypothetical protein
MICVHRHRNTNAIKPSMQLGRMITESETNLADLPSGYNLGALVSFFHGSRPLQNLRARMKTKQSAKPKSVSRPRYVAHSRRYDAFEGKTEGKENNQAPKV